MTKTISIYIFLEDEPSVECITAGNSAEHNATTLKFILESTFTDEFKYYLDFVLPNGKFCARIIFLSIRMTKIRCRLTCPRRSQNTVRQNAA